MQPTELLLQYQRLGDRAQILADEQHRIELRLEQDQPTQVAAEALAEAEDAHRQLALQVRALDLERETHRAKMRSHETELMSGRIRNPSDLMQMSTEVEHMKAALKEEEEREFEVMGALDEAESILNGAREVFAAATVAAETAEPGLRSRLAVVITEIADLEARREEIWAAVPPALQSAYRKIARIPHPVAAMVNGTCEGCRVQLTTNELQQLRRGDRFTCQNCQRILVQA